MKKCKPSSVFEIINRLQYNKILIFYISCIVRRELIESHRNLKEKKLYGNRSLNITKCIKRLIIKSLAACMRPCLNELKNVHLLTGTYPYAFMSL